MKHSIKRLFWAILVVVGLPLLYLSTQTDHLGLALIGKAPMVIWSFWTYDILTARHKEKNDGEDA